ncbi:hypothetical protein QTJ16_004593 [Diplocarpon rosae]|uniref:Uncharacterized protein n=1 Tax=Diplocarpon rosae TaxID=946125 RepID=A0AAD9SYZ1_9HELO|nr:hypothetical protein QTJ16_004593 [Diplocarpon rosae]
MLIKHSRTKKQVKIMDPDCAICSQPALAQCECEAKGLDIAVRQAEQRMMTSVFSEIRAWVRGHAQDYILSYFSMLTTRRKDQHAQAIHRMTEQAAYYYRARPHPSEIAAADAELKRGIDEDWKASVQRYPEVLEYFYGMVGLSLPGDDEPGVRDPPLSALGGVGVGRERERKVRLREPSEIEERRAEDRRRRRRSRGERDMVEERERLHRVPAPPTAMGGRERERGMYGPQLTGYGYVQPGY